ncbi:MAG: hypothetical protein U0W24_07215 [Bacteroidales bacterium]
MNTSIPMDSVLESELTAILENSTPKNDDELTDTITEMAMVCFKYLRTHKSSFQIINDTWNRVSEKYDPRLKNILRQYAAACLDEMIRKN